MYAIIAAIVGAIAGGIVSSIISYRSQAKSRAYSIYSSIDGIIDDLQCTLSVYWRSRGKNISQEQLVKQGLERLDLRIQALGRELGCRFSKSEFDTCMDELSDAATGGAFETANRPMEVARIYRIKTLCTKIKDAAHHAVG